jgi:hypothetical protein
MPFSAGRIWIFLAGPEDGHLHPENTKSKDRRSHCTDRKLPRGFPEFGDRLSSARSEKPEFLMVCKVHLQLRCNFIVAAQEVRLTPRFCAASGAFTKPSFGDFTRYNFGGIMG